VALKCLAISPTTDISSRRSDGVRQNGAAAGVRWAQSRPDFVNLRGFRFRRLKRTKSLTCDTSDTLRAASCTPLQLRGHHYYH